MLRHPAVAGPARSSPPTRRSRSEHGSGTAIGVALMFLIPMVSIILIQLPSDITSFLSRLCRPPPTGPLGCPSPMWTAPRSPPAWCRQEGRCAVWARARGHERPLCGAWGPSVPHRWPGWPAAWAGARCAQSPGRSCAHSGPRRSRLWPSISSWSTRRTASRTNSPCHVAHRAETRYVDEFRRTTA